MENLSTTKHMVESDHGCEYAFYDFGTVCTGARAFKTIKVLNSRTIPQRYEVNRDPDTNLLDHSFYVKPYVSDDIPPEKSFSFELEYSPVVPFTISYDYFNVIDSYGVCFKFGTKGKSLGPLVEISSRDIQLYSVGPDTVVEKSIVLSNDSIDLARFQFDIDETHTFVVNPRQGYINPNSKIAVILRFIPPSPGVYSKFLFCLIQYQAPLMVNIVGICTYSDAFKMEEIPLRRYIIQDILVGGYDSYVYDSKTIVEHCPPVVLNTNCIDFGKTNMNEELSISQTVCITNYIKTGVVVQWEEDPGGVFLMEPLTAKIAGNESAIFEVIFMPSAPNHMYSKELIARIHWDERTPRDSLELKDIVYDIAVPLTVSLRLMGHTFEEISTIWTPEYHICSDTVRMPPCVPPLSVYNTFCIERLGDRPLMFKFIAPETSHYVLKPSQGVITEEFQIVVVGVCPNSKEEGPYFERWVLQFNGSPQYEVTLDFCAFAEYPKIQINEENTVIFPPTFPRSEKNGQICLKNFTRHYIWYRFSIDDDENDLCLIDEEGSIASNEITYITWQSTPKHEGIKMSRVTCETCALLDCWCPFGTFIGTTVTVFTESEYTEFVSFPSEFECGVISYTKTITLKMHVFNFGRCKIYFALKCVPFNELCEFQPEDILLDPETGKIDPLSKECITISITPTRLGVHSLAIAYEILKNAKSNENALDKRIRLATIHYESVLSQVQIADLNFTGGGPMFSKLWVWRMLDINALNHLFLKLSPGDLPSVTVCVPQAVIGSEPLVLYVLLRNISLVKAAWNFKLIVTCRCVVREDHMTGRIFKHMCVHRDQICVYPASGELEAGDESILMIRIKYNVLGKNESRFKLALGNNRNVVLGFNVVSFPSNVNCPAVFTTSLDLEGVYVGESFPEYQAYWLYNSTNRPAVYYIDDKALKKFNERQMCDIITCLNPSGNIQPQSAFPILFQFSPRVLQTYEVDVSLCLGTYKNYTLKIKGNGIVSYQPRLQPLSFKSPKCSLFDLEEITTFLSVDHVLKGPFLTHGQEECIVFLQNRSTTIPVKFSWKKYFLPDFLSCTVEPAEGILQPRETKICKVNIRTYFQPFFFSIQIPCEIIDLNIHHKYQQTEALFKRISKEQEDMFTYTEKGLSKPNFDIPLAPEPKSLYRVLSISCDVKSAIQPDSKLTVGEQFRLYPSPEAVATPKSPDRTYASRETMKNILHHVLDVLLWDTLFNARFQDTLEQIRRESSLFYGQFVMDPKEEKKLLAMQCHNIPRDLLAKTVRDIIYDVFQEEFVVHKINNETQVFE